MDAGRGIRELREESINFFKMKNPTTNCSYNHAKDMVWMPTTQIANRFWNMVGNLRMHSLTNLQMLEPKMLIIAPDALQTITFHALRHKLVDFEPIWHFYPIDPPLEFLPPDVGILHPVELTVDNLRGRHPTYILSIRNPWLWWLRYCLFPCA